MISIWHHSTARVTRRHRIRLLSYRSRGTVMSYTDHSASSRTHLRSVRLRPLSWRTQGGAGQAGKRNANSESRKWLGEWMCTTVDHQQTSETWVPRHTPVELQQRLSYDFCFLDFIEAVGREFRNDGHSYSQRLQDKRTGGEWLLQKGQWLGVSSPFFSMFREVMIRSSILFIGRRLDGFITAVLLALYWKVTWLS